MKALQFGEIKRKEVYTTSVMLSYKVYHSQNGHFHPCKMKKQETYAQQNNSCCSFPFVTSKCRKFYKCAGHKKRDLFFTPVNVSQFTRVTLKNAGLHVKCLLIFSPLTTFGCIINILIRLV
jgi:hypothetical protein